MALVIQLIDFLQNQKLQITYTTEERKSKERVKEYETYSYVRCFHVNCSCSFEKWLQNNNVTV